MECGHHYVKLNVERYGGMIYAPWLDRPLSIAGRVIIKDKETNKLQSKLINIDRDLVLIPNLAIHMNRDINSGYQYNPQKDLLPLYGNLSAKDTFMKQIADAAEVSEQDILGHDLFLYNRQKQAYGALPTNLYLLRGLMICNVCLPLLKDFLQDKNKLICRFSPFWITKKLEVRQNRGLHLHFI